jgi:hypothetical protein
VARAEDSDGARQRTLRQTVSPRGRGARNRARTAVRPRRPPRGARRGSPPGAPRGAEDAVEGLAVVELERVGAAKGHPVAEARAERSLGLGDHVRGPVEGDDPAAWQAVEQPGGHAPGTAAKVEHDLLAAETEAPEDVLTRAELGVDRIAVLGHSILGALAIEYGRRCPPASRT